MKKKDLKQIWDLIDDDSEIYFDENKKEEIDFVKFDGKNVFFNCKGFSIDKSVLISKSMCSLSADSSCGYRDPKTLVCNKIVTCGYQNWNLDLFHNVNINL